MSLHCLCMCGVYHLLDMGRPGNERFTHACPQLSSWEALAGDMSEVSYKQEVKLNVSLQHLQPFSYIQIHAQYLHR